MDALASRVRCLAKWILIVVLKKGVNENSFWRAGFFLETSHHPFFECAALVLKKKLKERLSLTRYWVNQRRGGGRDNAGRNGC